VTLLAGVTAEAWEIAARTVYGEGRGEPFEGQVAIAWVIRNRAERPGWWGRDVGQVCLKPSQFSCWLATDPNRDVITAVTAENPAFRRCLGITALVLSGDLEDPTEKSTHYITLDRPEWASMWPPKWAGSMHKTVVIGGHQFLSERQA
jgi:spore germination cell wall hydrolase CwlJ-like protein